MPQPRAEVFVIPDWVNNNTLTKWRQQLKLFLLEERYYRSDLSGRVVFKTGCHMHEGILSRANVPKSIWWHYRIHHPYNSFLLLAEEHIPSAPSREWAIEKAYERYGKEVVQAWFYNLPFKSFPFQLPD